MRFLITGGNGFIASHLAVAIKSRVHGSRITILDRQFNKDGVMGGGFKRIQGDLTTINSVDLPEVDIVIHAAALLGVDFVNSNPNEVVLQNTASFSALQGYLSNELVKFIFFSTSEVYGDGYDAVSHKSNINCASGQLSLPDLDKNRSSYALSKIIGEYMASRSKNSLILRPHNVYGTRMGNRHVIPNLIEKSLNSTARKNIEIFNPDHLRCFCHIDDAIDQIMYLIDNDKIGKFNIGNCNEPVTIQALTELIMKKTNVNAKITVNSENKDSPVFRQPEICIPKESYVSLSAGVDQMIDSFKIKQSWF